MFEETFAAQNTREDMRVYLASAFNNARQSEELEDPNWITLLIENGPTLLGYAQLHVGEPPGCVPDRHAIELARFYVDRPYHGRGVAHTLMRAVLQAASPRSQTVWLGVWERNARAIAFTQSGALWTSASSSSSSGAIVRPIGFCGARMRCLRDCDDGM
jgi:diamine N-acetyltransferase